jgi:hypothetical protein
MRWERVRCGRSEGSREEGCPQPAPMRVRKEPVRPCTLPCMKLPAAALALAQRQYGVLSRRQLLTWLSAPALEGQVRRRNLQPLERGVYRVSGGVPLPGQEAIAAVLRCGPGAVLTGPFVLGHHRVPGFDLESPFEVLLQPGRRVSATSFPVRTDPQPNRFVQKVGDVRLAAPTDAMLESCLWRQEYEDRQLRVAYDQLRFRHGLTTAKMRRRIAARGPTDPAVVAFLRVVDDDPVTESEGERALAPILSRLDPVPEPQVWVTPARRVDFYLRGLRFGWEYLGDVDHRRLEDRRADADRDEELATQGIRLHYVVAADLRNRGAFVAAMMGALAHRADVLGVRMPTLRPIGEPA